MTERLVNNCTSPLVGTLTSGATTLAVSSAAGFPTTGNFRIVVDSGANLELMLVTSVSGTTFTITRGIEGTTAVSHAAGVAVTQVLTAAGLAQTIQDAINAVVMVGDATGGFATTLVQGIQGHAVPAPTSGYLHYNGTSFVFDTPGGGALTSYGADLAGSTATNQHVQSISGNAGGGGTVAITANKLSFSQASTVTTTVGNLLLDAVAGSAVGVGGTTAQIVSIGNTTATQSINLNLLAGTSNQFTVTNGVKSLVNLAASSSDYIAYGVTPAGSGHVRADNNATIVAARNAANSADISVLGTDASNVVGIGLLNAVGVTVGNSTTTSTITNQVTSAGTWYVNVGGTQALRADVALDVGLASVNFLSSLTSGTIGWSGAASGAGAPISVVGQTGASGQQGGAAVLISGAPGSGAKDGNVGFVFGGTSSTDTVAFQGATTSAGRGTLQWSSALTPALSQAAPSTVAVPSNFTIAPQAPNGGSGTKAQNTPGSFVVALAVPGAVGTAGAEAMVMATRGGLFAGGFGPYPTAPTTYDGVWLGPGITPGSSNYVLISDGASTTVLNAPGGGSTFLFQINGTSTVDMTATALYPSFDVTVSNGDATHRWAALYAQGISVLAGGIGGNSAQSTAMQLQSTGTAISVTANATLTAAQAATPVLSLTGAIHTGSVTISIPNNVGATYFFDVRNVTGWGTNTLIFATSTGSVTPASISAAPSGGRNMIVVVISASGVVVAD